MRIVLTLFLALSFVTPSLILIVTYICIHIYNLLSAFNGTYVFMCLGTEHLGWTTHQGAYFISGENVFSLPQQPLVVSSSLSHLVL